MLMSLLKGATDRRRDEIRMLLLIASFRLVGAPFSSSLPSSRSVFIHPTQKPFVETR
jgi:hypothetical protein